MEPGAAVRCLPRLEPKAIEGVLVEPGPLSVVACAPQQQGEAKSDAKANGKAFYLVLSRHLQLTGEALQPIKALKELFEETSDAIFLPTRAVEDLEPSREMEIPLAEDHRLFVHNSRSQRLSEACPAPRCAASRLDSPDSC